MADFNNDAFSGYENANNDTEYSTVVEKHESCGFTEQSNTNNEYEEPSSTKPELIQEATSETGGINLTERKAAMYQNSTTDGSHTSRLPMKSSKFLNFMKGGMSRQKILADSKVFLCFYYPLSNNVNISITIYENSNTLLSQKLSKYIFKK